MYKMMLSANKTGFTSFFPIFIPFISLFSHMVCFVDLESGYSFTGCSPQAGLEVTNRCQLGCVLIQRLNWGRIQFQVHSDCWKNSYPCGQMNDGLNFFMAVSWRTPSGPRSYLQFLATGNSPTLPLTSSSPQGKSVAPVCYNGVLNDKMEPQQ